MRLIIHPIQLSVCLYSGTVSCSFLYSGISNGNGCITQNPILSNLEQRNNFKKIENKFFRKKGEWNRFIKSSNI